MRRREFLTAAAFGFAATRPLAARAQDKARVRRVVMITGNFKSDPEAERRMTTLRRRLSGLGWTDGVNVALEHIQIPVDADQMRGCIAGLVDAKPDVIVTQGTPLTAVVKRQTRTIPVVFTLVADPVGSGLVASLARPGSNITGLTNFEYSMGGKWLETLREKGAGHSQSVECRFYGSFTHASILRRGVRRGRVHCVRP